MPGGVEEALIRANEVEGIAVEFSTQLPAVLRQVLLPVVVHALGAPAGTAEWQQRFARGSFNNEERQRLREYLDEHRARFDLFDPAEPFAQAAGLRTAKDETKGSAALVATAASGNNVPLFASRTDADPLELTPAQAAHWLLHTHCWDTAAIKTGAAGDPQVKAGKTTGNPTGPLGQLGVVIPTGRTLYETLLLNIPITPKDGLGTPHWCQPSAGATWRLRTADGLLDVWTWQSRRVRLIPQETAEGARVTRVVITAGDRLATVPEWEPHTTWAFTEPVKKTVASSGVLERCPRRHVQGRAAWRGLEALLAPVRHRREGRFATSILLDQIAALRDEDRLDADYPLQVQTFGMVYGTQSAVVEDAIHDAIPMPVLALRRDSDVHELLMEATDQAEKLAWAVNNLSADLRRAVGADPIPWDKGQRPGELLLHRLDPAVRRLLAALCEPADGEVFERGRLAWEQRAAREAWAVADPLLEATPAGAFIGRETEHNGRRAIFSLGMAAGNFRYQIAAILPRQAKTAREAAQACRAQPYRPPRRPSESTVTTEHRTPPRPYWEQYVGPDGTWRKDARSRTERVPPGEHLAAMRTGLGRPPRDSPKLWPHYSCEIDDIIALGDEASDGQEAEHAALTLYGLHQQGQPTPMHRPGIKLGHALRLLRRSGKFSEEALDVRVATLAAAPSVPALLVHLRGLITQLCAIAQPLDYTHLMSDIQAWHSPDRRPDVRLKWALGYQSWKQNPPT